VPSVEHAFDRLAVRLDGPVLEVDVGYRGGCGTHTFDLFYDGNLYRVYPPQASVVLAHDANGDDCDAYSRETVRFDVGELGRPLRIKVYGGGESYDSVVRLP
jgi:hypothetical protein